MVSYDLGLVKGQDANITQTITDGDTTHCPSADAVYEYVDAIIGSIIEDMEQ